MKNLIISASKVLKLSLVIIVFASASVIAGGNEKTAIKKTHDENYAHALKEMAEALNKTEEFKNIYTPATQIKIYDANFNLVKEVEIAEDGKIVNEEILILIHQATELMQFENTTYYILNN